jgi:hypothetical protein
MASIQAGINLQVLYCSLLRSKKRASILSGTSSLPAEWRKCVKLEGYYILKDNENIFVLP